ncbi:MAG: hypothetical protein N3A66_01865 [Planctomycetota bacterium]|nr:hypothetical protein [Planctomycetota bacterium]
MSYEIGWAAINLEMPKRVPHFFIGNADTRILLRGERAFYNEVYEELCWRR